MASRPAVLRVLCAHAECTICLKTQTWCVTCTFRQGQSIRRLMNHLEPQRLYM